MSREFQNSLILLVVATLTLVADRITKTIIANNLFLNASWSPPGSLLQPIFRLTHTTNTGAAFGLFPNQGVLFIVIAFVVVTAIVYYYRHLPAGYGLVRLALGLQLGGVMGNLLDRLRQGYVTDFIDLSFWPLQDWPVFNLADSAIVVGVGLLALTMLREEQNWPDPETTPSEGDAASEPGAFS